MKRWGILLSMCLLVLGTAMADTFDFTYAGGLYSGSGTLQAINNGNGTFTATSGSGVFDGFAISLIANPSAPNSSNSPSGAFYYDDLLFPTATPVIDSGGLLFSINGLGATELNICSVGAGCGTTYTALLNNGGGDTGRFTLSAVPEPSTLTFLGLGLLGITTLKRRISKPSQLL